MEINIGIDLGTTNTVVCYSRRGRPDYLDFGNSSLLPSAVYVKEDNTTVVGDMAIRMGHNNPQRLIRSSKTHMGDMDFIYPDSAPKLSFSKKFTPTDIAELILTEVKQTLIDEEICDEDDTINAVITVPAYFASSQISETQEAGKRVGFNIKDIIAEPTAAAIAYVRNQIKNKTRIFVVDFGGGTFDITLLEYDESLRDKYLPVASGGDNHLGGDDIDDVFVKMLMERVKDDCGVDLSDMRKSGLSRDAYLKVIANLYSHAKEAKHKLSEKTEYKIDILELLPNYSFSTVITRKQFNKCCDGIYRKVLDCISELLNEGNIDIRSIDDIILVGGSCYIPMIGDMVEEVFHKKPKISDLSNVVALGAYISASEGISVAEKTAYDLGIEVLKKDNYTETEFNTIIPRGSRVPCSFSNNYAPATDNQKEIKVNVYERSAKILPDDNNIDKCNFIGSIPFNDFQSGKTTDTIINVKFEFDKSRILRVKLTDVRTGSTKTKVLDKKKHKIAPQNLSPEPMDIFLLIDSSGSMEGSKINSVRKAIKLLLTDMIDMNISRVGIISFDETHKVISKLTSDKEYIINKTKEIITGGGTCPSSGFEEAYKQLKATRTQKKQAVIMLTDGVVFSCDKLLTKNACKKIKDSGMRLITIGAGADINKDFLEEIASENNGRKDMYTISNMEQLASTFRQIINSLRKL